MVNGSYANYEWFLKQDLSKYSGKWLAIINKKVVANGKKLSTVIKEANTKHPNKKPLITKIRKGFSIL